MQKNTAILITGATGLVGAHLCQLLLAQGYHNLFATHRSGSSKKLLGTAADDLQWRNMELDDYFSVEAALEGIEIVIHSAAMVSFQAKDKNALLQINRVGTRYVANAALQQGVSRLIYISSVAALGRNTLGYPINEDSKWEDGPEITHYARSKFLAELEVWRAQAEGLSVAVLYPSIILGAGDWSSGSSKLISYAHGNSKYYPGGSTGLVDVKDVAQAILLTLERNKDGDRFLLNATNISYQEMLTKMSLALNTLPPQRLLSKKMAFLLTWIDKWRAFITRSNPLLTRETVANAYHHYLYDSSKSEDELGIVYRDLDASLEDVANAFLVDKK